MAKYFLATITFILFSVLLMPLSALAAWNTVVFTEDTNIVIGSTTLVISSGGDVASMTIYDTYVSFEMESGSNVVVTSNNRYILANSLSAGVECEASYSRISLNSSATQTVTVTPSSEICGSSGGGSTGGGRSVSDLTAPSISGIASVPSNTTAVISWATNESSISWILYGTSTDYGSEEKTTSYLTSHSVTLTGLTAETTYHYQVKSKDSAGNIGAYTDKTFTTLAVGEESAEEEEEEEEDGPEDLTIPQITFDKPISEMTIPELQDKVKEILEAIGVLQTLLAQMTGGSAIADVPASFSFEKNLEIGDVMIDVKYLQIVLNSASDTRLAASGVGSPGSETNYFGPLTKSAVIKFQNKYADEVLASWGLTSGTGYVGSTTRDKLNELLGK